MVVSSQDYLFLRIRHRLNILFSPIYSFIQLLIMSIVKPVPKKKRENMPKKTLKDVKTIKNIPNISKNVPLRGG